MSTESTNSLREMSSQVISYRLSTKEVLELRQKALPGESDSQTAQRLMRVVLGLSTETSISSTLTLDERIENVVEKKLSAFVVNQNDLLNRLQERLHHTESRLEEMLTARAEAQVSPVSVDNVDRNVNSKERVTHPAVDNVDKIADKKSDRFLSGADLAKRLGVNPATLSKNRAKPNFAQWSQRKDPEQWAWQYVSKMEQYTPVLSTILSTRSTDD
jgi:hypothetical protein